VAEQIADCPMLAVDGYGCAAHFGEAERGVKGVRNRIGRNQVNFADHARVAGKFRAFEEIGVQSFCIALAPCKRGGHNSIDVDEAVVVFAEPEKIGAVVVGVLIEGDKKGSGLLEGTGEKTVLNQPVKFGKREWREFGSVRVVERKEWHRRGTERPD
jgi:hypothetical protein